MEVQNPEKILIIRLSAIGDVIRVIPAVEAIRSAYPEAIIDWLVEDKSKDIVEGHPAINECIVFHRSQHIIASTREFIRLCRYIKQKQYTIALDFHGILKSGILSFCTQAKRRIAFAPPRAQECSYLFATETISLPMGKVLSRVEENVLLAQSLGVQEVLHWRGVHIPYSVDEEVKEYLEQCYEPSKRLVLIHPAVDRPEKQWDLRNFAILADLLLSDGRFEVMLTWGPSQRTIAEHVAREMKHPVIIAPQTPTLKHLACLIQHADLFISCDTGPMHLAWILDKPVIGIFGGTNPEQHAPQGPHCKALYKGPQPFPKRLTLPQAQQALNAITPEEVYHSAIELLFPSTPSFC